MPDTVAENLDPRSFLLWQPPAGRAVLVGPEQRPLPLPPLPLPIRRSALEESDEPVDNAVGEGLYDYLRQFPDCRHAAVYAALLRDGFPHYLADLASQAIMLDEKEVDPPFVARKLTCLKVLRLLEPGNAGLLWQLARGFHDLALTSTELPRVRRNLLEALRFGQDLLKVAPDNPAVLGLLAEVDILFGDYPAAVQRLRRVLELPGSAPSAAGVRARLEQCEAIGFPDHPLVDDLEQVGAAMQLMAAHRDSDALEILERLELDEYFMAELESADFHCLLGVCRSRCGDGGGAFASLSRALELDPQHEQARHALDAP